MLPHFSRFPSPSYPPPQRCAVLRSPRLRQDAGGEGSGQRVLQGRQERGLLHEEGSRLSEQVGGGVGEAAPAAL